MRVEFTVNGKNASALRRKAEEVMAGFGDEGEWLIESFDASPASVSANGPEWVAQVCAWDGKDHLPTLED